MPRRNKWVRNVHAELRLSVNVLVATAPSAGDRNADQVPPRTPAAVPDTVKTGEATREITYGLTSLGVPEAGLDELLDIVRRHWEVEKRVHYVRDFSYDEDSCRAFVQLHPREGVPSGPR